MALKRRFYKKKHMSDNINYTTKLVRINQVRILHPKV